MKTAKALKKGDTVGIAAASSPFDRGLFKKGIKVLGEMGFKVYYRDDIFDQTRYLAGSDERRAKELMELFSKTDVRAIFFARGGYGSQRIIPMLNVSLIRKNPKPVVGFSDITALLIFLRQDCRAPTFYGPVVTTLAKTADPDTKNYLLEALTKTEPIGALPLASARVLKSGSVEGILVGGCVSLINSSIGTPYELDTKDAVLFLEETGEKVYVLDRMLTQLKNAGKFSNAKAVIFGSLVLAKGETNDTRAMISDVFRDFDGPVIIDYPAGHSDKFITLPLGANIQVNAEKTGVLELNLMTNLLG